MPRKALLEKAKREPKFSVRRVRRCGRCGRSRSVYRRYNLCRVCLREMALRGQIPGMRKASW